MKIKQQKNNSDLFVFECKALQLPLPNKEYKFCSTRKWRCDYAWPEYKLAVEIEGGLWKYGRHNNPKGYINDMEKYNNLSLMKWTLLRYQPNNIDWEQIKYVLKGDKIL